jgi:RHS repeat-associated protein
MPWSRSVRVFLVIVLAVGLTQLGLRSRPEPAGAATGDAVVLAVPSLVHSTGAELSWSRFAGPSAFAYYEVQRAAAGTTNWSQLVRIDDPDTTRWVDTTARPGSGVSYRVTVNGTDPSNQVNFNGKPLPDLPLLPAEGQARLALQPGPSDGQATYIVWDRSSPAGCYDWYNYGAATNLRIGMAANGVVHRPLLWFDLRAIPPKASVLSATLTLTYPATSAPTNLTGRGIDLHRVTRAWQEGRAIYPGACDGSGADWGEAQAGMPWSATQNTTTHGGGDYDATPDAPPGLPKSRTIAGTDTFNVAALVREWVNDPAVTGTAPNLGMLLKMHDDFPVTIPTDNPYFDYRSDDYATASERPKLVVTFADGSHGSGPSVALSSPAAGDRVHGTVPVTAAAADDGAVTRVDLAVDGTPLAADTTAPYTTTWDTTAVASANGQHTLTATAYDEAGNSTTTSGTVTVDNTAAPVVSGITPAAGITVSGTLPISATVTDDVGVTKVEFYADGRHLADKTTEPYTTTWDTLDPLNTAFDDPPLAARTTHTVTVKAYDRSGNVTTRSVEVYVDNTTGTRYRARFVLNGSAADAYTPPVMPSNTAATSPDPYDPGGGGRNLSSRPVDTTGTTSATTGAGSSSLAEATSGGGTCPASAYCPTVTVYNDSDVDWKNPGGTDLRLWYRWYTTDGQILYEGPAADNFPTVVQAHTAAKPLPVVINPPALPAGIDLSLVRLRLDVYDTDASSATPRPTWFSQQGNKPKIDNPVVVTRELDDALGLERYYGYQQTSLGGGMTAAVNVANGNLLARWSPFNQPGRGLATVAGLTYNSLEDHSHSPAGNNWSLSVSTLTRLGEPLDIHPNQADTISGRSNKYIQFIDADGTPHRFNGTTNPDGTTSWTAPPGVHLFVRSVTTDQAALRYWALSRPDHVTFYYDFDGFPTAVVDKNGNTLTINEDPTPAGEDPGGPKKRVSSVTDARGRAVQLAYYGKDEAKSPHIRGNIKDLTDHGGHVWHFDYYEDGNLLRITQRGGTTAAGAFLADRSWVFTYTTSAGDGPAIGAADDRGTNPGTPDPRTPNQSTRLYSVRDPNGHETTFSYFGPGSSQKRWKLASLTDRAGKTTGYDYDLNGHTTITDPLQHATVYGYDTSGRPISVINAKQQTTQLAWTSDFMLRQLTEPNPAAHTDYTYNANGYLASITTVASATQSDQTLLTYENRPLDATDPGTHWSLLKTKTSPRGTDTATPGDYTWTFGYNTSGDFTSVLAPGQTNAAVYTYDGFGQLTTATSPNGALTPADPNDFVTRYDNYDPNGLPQQVTDPLGRVTGNGFDADGQQLWVQTPAHSGASGADVRSYRTYFDYDSFHRLGRRSEPKSTRAARGLLVWTTVSHDPNDNLTVARNPVYGSDDPSNDPQTPTTTFDYDLMDRRTLMTSPDTSADPAGARTRYDYDDVGNLTKVTDPISMKVGGANPNPTLVNTYDAVNRVVARAVNDINPTGGAIEGHRTSYACYDTVGNLAAVYQPLAGLTAPPGSCPAATAANAAAHTTLYGYDLAHRQTLAVEPQTAPAAAARTRVTHYYPDGSVKDRVDEAGKTTSYDYDQRGLPTRVEEPFNGSRTLTTLYRYDADGNQTRLISPRAYDASSDKTTFTDFVTSSTYDQADRLVVTSLPTGTASNGKATPAAYVYRSYDADARISSTSLPVSTAPSASDPTQPSSPLSATAQTKVDYWDPGWVRTQTTGPNPAVRFDHTAEGWQAERTPATGSGPSKSELWSYFPSGSLRARSDPEGHTATYTYDADRQLVKAVSNIGVTDPTQATVTVGAAYNGYGELTKTTRQLEGQSFDTFSTYGYTDDGQLASRNDNGKEGGQTANPDRVSMVYDGADWLTDQYDQGTTASCAGDQHIATTYQPTGWEAQRVIARMPSSCTAESTTPGDYTSKQTTNWTYNDNGKLATLGVRNAQGQVLQTHTVGYDDPAGVYNNGSRTSDQFALNGPGSTQCTGSTPSCTASYVYDARDKLIASNDGHGTQTTYTLDGALTGCPTPVDTTIRAGNVTAETAVTGAATKTTGRCFAGSQQATQTDPAGITSKYWYDDLGRLWCITSNTVTDRSACNHSDGAAADARLRQVNTYDYLDHLIGTRRYNTSGAKTDSASYVYDALDRVVTEKETHTQGSVAERTTDFTYLGLSKQAVNDHQSTKTVCAATDQPTLTADKSYLYDADGHRITLGDRSATCAARTQPTTPTRYDYGYDVHGSVATLNKDGNTATTASAVYAYTPYGTEDDQADQANALSKGDVLQQGTTRNDNPLNPFRYAAKRYDTGSQTLDTGARRFDPGSGRFLQQDFYRGALDDLRLSTDPLNQNRYALAAANPIGYTESDGHTATAIPDGGGGSSSPSPADFRIAEEAQKASTPPGGSYGGTGYGGARPPSDRGPVLDSRGAPFLTADQARDVILARCGQDRQCIRDEANKAEIAAYAQKKLACRDQRCIRKIDQDLKYMLYDWTGDSSVFGDLVTFQENLHDQTMKYGSIVGMGFALGCIVTGGGCMVAGVIGAALMADDVATCAGADVDPAKSHGGCKYVLADAITLYVGARNRSMVGRSEPIETEIGGIRYAINPGTMAKVYEQGFVIMSTGAVVIPDDWGIDSS